MKCRLPDILGRLRKDSMGKHQYKFQVLEQHLDTFGHVNNANYLTLYEQARWQMISEKGYTLERVLAEKIGPVILDLNMTFKKELRLRQWITIETRFIEYKNKLVGVVAQEMFNEEGEFCSSLTLSVGLFDIKKRKLMKPTEDWQKAIGAL